MPNWHINGLTQAVTDLRVFLHDGPNDRFVKQKIVAGAVDGANTEFFTFEDRILNDARFQVTVDFQLVAAVIDDAIEGRLHTTLPPAEGTTVRARYFFQYFLDSDLQQALQDGAIQCLDTDQIVQVPLGMEYAVMNYAGHFAYQKQSMRWAERMSHKFLLEEEPLINEALNRSNLFQRIANDLIKNGEHFRDDFYKRKGRQFIPSFGVYKPRIGAIGPRT